MPADSIPSEIKGWLHDYVHVPSVVHEGAMMEAVKLYPGVKKALVILPDSIRNYLTKFVNDAMLAPMMHFPPDIAERDVKVNRLIISSSRSS